MACNVAAHPGVFFWYNQRMLKFTALIYIFPTLPLIHIHYSVTLHWLCSICWDKQLPNSVVAVSKGGILWHTFNVRWLKKIRFGLGKWKASRYSFWMTSKCILFLNINTAAETQSGVNYPTCLWRDAICWKTIIYNIAHPKYWCCSKQLLLVIWVSFCCLTGISNMDLTKHGLCLMGPHDVNTVFTKTRFFVWLFFLNYC